MYQGNLGFCDHKMNFYVSKQDCEGEWIEYRHNFDNILEALPTLFLISTLDGWGEHFQICFNSYQ